MSVSLLAPRWPHALMAAAGLMLLRPALGQSAAPGELVLPGQAIAYQSAILTAKVAGFVKLIAVDKGDHVKAGSLIAELQVPELEADQLRYKAELNVAQRENERVAQAARSAPDLVTADAVDAARGRLEVAQAQLSRIQTLLNYARITAPFSGTITARFVDPGAYLPVASAANQQAAAVVTLMDFSRVRVQVGVPEANAGRVRPGTPARISVPGAAAAPIKASVTRVSYAVDPSSHTMLAEILIDNQGLRLQPGEFLSVTLAPSPGAP